MDDIHLLWLTNECSWMNFFHQQQAVFLKISYYIILHCENIHIWLMITYVGEGYGMWSMTSLGHWEHFIKSQKQLIHILTYCQMLFTHKLDITFLGSKMAKKCGVFIGLGGRNWHVWEIYWCIFAWHTHVDRLPIPKQLSF